MRSKMKLEEVTARVSFFLAWGVGRDWQRCRGWVPAGLAPPLVSRRPGACAEAPTGFRSHPGGPERERSKGESRNKAENAPQPLARWGWGASQVRCNCHYLCPFSMCCIGVRCPWLHMTNGSRAQAGGLAI